uniref:Uncharacterized protein n=1 Tax=Peronospora matthiolae TaxID=2874970 RepID=A0AAV1VGI8_9STRA
MHITLPTDTIAISLRLRTYHVKRQASRNTLGRNVPSKWIEQSPWWTQKGPVQIRSMHSSPHDILSTLEVAQVQGKSGWTFPLLSSLVSVPNSTPSKPLLL